MEFGAVLLVALVAAVEGAAGGHAQQDADAEQQDGDGEGVRRRQPKVQLALGRLGQLNVASRQTGKESDNKTVRKERKKGTDRKVEISHRYVPRRPPPRRGS